MAGYQPSRQSLMQNYWNLLGNWGPNSDVWKNISLVPGATGTFVVRFGLPRSTVPGTGSRITAAAIDYTIRQGGIAAVIPRLILNTAGGDPDECIVEMPMQVTPSGFNLNPGACHKGVLTVLSPTYDNTDACEFWDFIVDFAASDVGAAIRVDCIEVQFDFNSCCGGVETPAPGVQRFNLF